MRAQDRGSWRRECRAGLEDATEKRIKYDEQERKRKAAAHAGLENH